MKSIAVAVIAIFVFSGCSWFGPAEEYKTESGWTTYRSADQSPTDPMTPAPQKIPGESRR